MNKIQNSSARFRMSGEWKADNKTKLPRIKEPISQHKAQNNTQTTIPPLPVIEKVSNLEFPISQNDPGRDIVHCSCGNSFLPGKAIFAQLIYGRINSFYKCPICLKTCGITKRTSKIKLETEKEYPKSYVSKKFKKGAR